jgi:cytochrome c553
MKIANTLIALLVVACATVQAQTPSPQTATGTGAAPATPQAGAQASTAGAATQNPSAAGSIESKVAMCIGCHGIKGYKASFPEVHQVPMISGQNAKYIAAALKAYQAGDRKHPTMRGIAGSLSEQDINDIAAYYESHGKDLPKAPDALPPANAQVTALLQKAACVSCHGANLSKPIDPSYPKIAGQHADYLFVALKAYKTEGNQAVGRSNGVMGAIAKQFSNAELKALSQYVGSLQGELEVKPESRFRK